MWPFSRQPETVSVGISGGCVYLFNRGEGRFYRDGAGGKTPITVRELPFEIRREMARAYRDRHQSLGLSYA
jgi:hypothetical protein